MKANLKVLCCVLAGFICYGFMNGPEDNNSSLVSAVAMQQDNNLKEQAAEIFQKNCAVTGCHTGKYAKRRLNLGPEFFVNNLVDVQSRQIDSLLRVDTTNPQQSYMLMKIRGDESIAGERMPLDSPPLSYSDIKTIESWVYSLSDQSLEEGYTREEAAEARTEFEQPPFWGTRVINLPTTTNIGEHDLLFRVSHRFFFPIKEGYEVYWGLNGPADVLLSLGFGITQDVSISIGHETLSHQWEIAGKWNMIHQGGGLGLPLNAALFLGGGWVTQEVPGKETFRSENMKFNAQLILSRQIVDDLSLLLVPAYSSNTNPLEDDSEGTLALGIGTKYTFYKQHSIIAEYIPVLNGYEQAARGWGIGWEAKAGGHVFQVFITNNLGLTADQYLPGGTLKIEENEYRFGFNIFRSFWF